MTQEMGETRDAMGHGLMKLLDTWVTNLKDQKEPYYLVFSAKPDKSVNGIRQAMRAYGSRPPKLLGVLVWYVDNAKGLVELVSELSSPPDIPLNPEFLSSRPEDQLPVIMERGKQFNILVS